MEKLAFWVAFFVYPALLIAFGAHHPAIITKPGVQWMQPVLIAVTLGSLVVAGSAYVGYFTGWFENFPRSIFVLIWLVIAALSLIGRLVFRSLKVYKKEVLPA